MTSWSVACIVVTNEGPGERLRRCLAALDRAGGCDRVAVVDNSSAAPTRGHPAKCYGNGATAVITMANRGYGAAANRGFAWARAHAPRDASSAVVLLNDDVVVRAGWLSPLLDALESDSEVGAVQPKILFATDGTVNSAGVELDRYHAGSDIGFGAADRGEWEGPASIEAFSGGAVLFRSAFLDDTGGFDERFFLYYEDVDLSLRGRARGWRFVCRRDSIVEHEFGASTAAMGVARRQMQERNRLWVVMRHGAPRTVIRAFGLSVRRLGRAPRRAHVAALVGGVAGAPLMLFERWRDRRRILAQ